MTESEHTSLSGITTGTERNQSLDNIISSDGENQSIQLPYLILTSIQAVNMCILNKRAHKLIANNATISLTTES